MGDARDEPCFKWELRNALKISKNQELAAYGTFFPLYPIFIRPQTDRSSGGRERVCGRWRRLLLAGAACLARVVRGWPGWRPAPPLETRRARRRAVFEVVIIVRIPGCACDGRAIAMARVYGRVGVVFE